MKVKCIGKVLSRTQRTTKSGDLYSIVVEEPGLYPNSFQFSSKNAALFGQKDGPCGVGKLVVAEGYANGSARDAKRTNGEHFTAYSVYLTLQKLAPYGGTVMDPSAAPGAPAPADEPEDMPF